VKKGAIWPYLIAGALALHVIVSLIAVFIATSDPSYAVEKDYYRKALAWDGRRVQENTNQALGWRFEFAVTPPGRPSDQAKLEASIRDDAGRPLSGAAVSVETFHNSRSDDILRARLEATGEAGVYRTTLPMQHNGRWELRFTIDHNGRRFTHAETRHLFVEGNWE
jgi:hypothetical protein